MRRFVLITSGLLMLATIYVASAAADDRLTCQAISKGQSGATVVQACTRAIESAKWKGITLAQIYNHRGLAFRDQGEYDRAIADANQAMRIVGRKDDILYYNRGLSYNGKREHDLAIADYTETIRLNPKYADAFHSRARSYYDKGDYIRAIADNSEAIRLKPNHASYYGGRGVAYFKSGQYELAIRDFSEAIRLGSTSSADYQNRGFTYERVGELAKALADFRRALNLDSRQPGAAEGVQRIEEKLASSVLVKSAAVAQASVASAPTSPAGPGGFPLSDVSTPEVRVALVIGNGDYRNVPALSNPQNDASDVAAALQRLGFSVKKVTNVGFDEMRRALLEFGRQARSANMAVVFYAGHGMEVGGENWLIPVDAQLTTDIDVDNEAMGLRALMLAVSNANRLGLVILDSCRNNPFAAKIQRTIRTRSVDRGLARVEPTDNVLVAFAAKDGTTANDGGSRNSPFTAALLKHLETPGLEVQFLFRNVRDDVMVATKREQQPFVYGSLSKTEIYLARLSK